MGSKDAPLANVSAKTYLFKIDLKVIKKKIKVWQKKARGLDPIQTRRRGFTPGISLKQNKEFCFQSNVEFTALQQSAVRKAKAQLEAAQGISVLQCHLVGITATPAGLEYSRHPKQELSQPKKRSFNVFQQHPQCCCRVFSSD